VAAGSGSLGAASSELSRPRGAVGSGAAAVVLLSRPRFRSVVRVVRVGALEGWDSCEVRLCDPCARVRQCVPCVSRVCPGSPGVFLPVSPGVFLPVYRYYVQNPVRVPVCVLARAAGRVRGSSALSSCEFLRSSVPGRIATRWCSDGGR
jgi:hypothetical protein